MMPTYPDPQQIRRIIEQEARAEPEREIPDPVTGSPDLLPGEQAEPPEVKEAVEQKEQEIDPGSDKK